MPDALEDARRAKPHVAAEAGRFGRVVGVGLSKVDGRWGVKVNFATAPKASPPARLHGVDVVYEVTGIPTRRPAI